MSEATVNLAFRPTTRQAAILGDRNKIVVILGGFGSSKTTLGAIKTILLALQHPWTQEYNNRRPTIGVFSPTSQNLRETQLATILQYLPPVFLKKYHRNYNKIELTNGCFIQGFPAKGKAFEGTNLVGAWIDEAHYIYPEVFHNIISRFERDQIAHKLGRPTQAIVTGIPYFASALEENFREPREKVSVYHLSMFENPYLTAEQKKQSLFSCPRDQQRTKIYGQWGAAPNLIYSSFNYQDHLITEGYGRHRIPTEDVHLGIDVGSNYSAVLFAHLVPWVMADGTTGKKLIVFDEWIEEQSDPDRIGKKLSELLWANQIKSYAIDPTTRSLELQAFARWLPGRKVIKQKHQTRAESEAYGIYTVQTNLKDALDNVRIGISSELKKNAKGLLNILRVYRYKPKSSVPMWAETEGDHSADCLRYLAVAHLPIKPPKKEAYGTFQYL